MHTPTVRHYFLLAALAGVSILALFIIRPFLVTLALAAIFSVVIYPVYALILRKLRLRPLAAVLSLILISFCVLLPIAFLSFQVFTETEQLYVSLTQNGNSYGAEAIASYIGASLEHVIPGAAVYLSSLSIDISIYVRQGLQWLLEHAGVAFSSVLTLALHLFIFFMALYAFLIHGPVLRKKIVTLSPLEDEDDERIVKNLALTINSVVRGSLAVALIQGLLAVVGFTIFGVPNPFLWGMVTSVAALIPGVGTTLVILPTILYLFATGNVLAGIGFTAWGLLVVGLVDNFLGPKLMGRGIKLHPLVILISVLGGVTIFGPAGIFLGPITMSLLFVFFSIYSSRRGIAQT